jgi:sugar lactone lactonase YvrE
MRRSRSLWAFLLLLLSPLSARAGDTRPDRVLGQPNLSANGANMIDRRGLSYPEGIAVDASVTPNRLYVADTENHRVLGWRDVASLRNGEPADLVFGQPTPFTGICNTGSGSNFGTSASTLCRPTGLAVDRVGNLYVSDSGNSRVLEYGSPFTTDTVADRLFGQPGFSEVELWIDPTAASLSTPGSLALDGAGNLYVADRQHNRVVRYDAPLTTDAVADRVYGQADFETSRCDFPDAGNLCFPSGIEVDPAGRLWVVASGRILEYDATGDTVADRVFSTDPEECFHDQPRSASTLCGVTALAFDPAGNQYLVTGDNRVLEFNGSLLADAVADRVFGQADFTGKSCNRYAPPDVVPLSPSAGSLCLPMDAATDSSGNLYVVDRNNVRVLVYRSPLTDPVADVVLGQGRFDTDVPNSRDRRGMVLPQGLAVDRSVSPNRLYVMDAGNQRVLGWRDAEGFYNGAPADLAIEGLLVRNNFVRAGLAVDSRGNLYVPEVERQRVLELDSPFETDTRPDRIFGRGAAPGTGCAPEIRPDTLCYPADVAVDAQGNVSILDAFHNRVLWYRTPLSRDTLPDRVYGQKGSFRTGQCNKGGISADSLCPLECRDVRCHNDYTEAGLAVDEAGHLYVSDFLNHRVLMFDTSANDTTADRVFGQRGSFRTNACAPAGGAGGAGGRRLCSPAGVAVGPSGDLYVADTLDRRVVRYGAPPHRERILQIFQGTDDCTGRPGELCIPAAVALDDEEDLFVADPVRHRVLVYDADH